MMWLKGILVLCAFAAVFGQDDTEEDISEEVKLAEGEKKLSENILVILDHFKQPDPVGVPGADIPDPFAVPDIKKTLSLGTLVMTKTVVYGMSKLRIQHVDAEVGAMQAKIIMTIDKLHAQGNYTISSWFSSSRGPFTVDITGLTITAMASLGVEQNGKLQAQTIDVKINFNKIATNFENIGFLGGMVQSLINNGGTFIFDASIPPMLKEAYPKIRAEINSKLEEFAGDVQFPNSISPLDMVIIDFRKKVRDMKLDPYQIKDYNTTVSIFTVTLANTWVTGISSFQRVGNITLRMENNTAVADFEIGTQKLEGKTQWEISAVSGLMSGAGSTAFSVEYITARLVLAQPLDTRKKPVFRDIDLEMGNIQIRNHGAGTIDYVVEFMVNIIPNLLRYQIMDGIEGPLKRRIQQELDKINVEEVVKQELPKLDEMQSKGFKLSDIKSSAGENEPYDEDEFFNF
ncbi:uncharacterized protein LOC113492892 [Trichoplusia ni]|uniref:Uncharacterized protein LOC113492892 n=1 Tax=Trichoplusia ni TaxID=7111 RepID=A0A7E5VDM8_TRINI|nr:uncharacterized protein LOC113492892 [Trichoplusia ni]